MLSNKSKDYKIVYFGALIYLIIFAFLVAILLGFIYICIDFYAHEFGHILSGIFNDFISGNPIQNYTISNWVPSPFPWILLPQQTMIFPGKGSVLFSLGGMFTSIILFWLICFIIYMKFDFKTKDWLVLIPFYALITELLDNYLCGTDNPIHKPYTLCQENLIISLYFNWNFLLLLLIFFILIFPLLLTELPFLIDKIRVLKGYKADYL